MAKQVLLVNLNNIPIGHASVPETIAIVKIGDGFFYRTGLISQVKPFRGQDIFLQSPVLLPTLFTPLKQPLIVVK